jgi:hypothetical protein
MELAFSAMEMMYRKKYVQHLQGIFVPAPDLSWKVLQPFFFCEGGGSKLGKLSSEGA